MSVDRFRKIVAASTIRPLQEGHAYSLTELRELLTILRPEGERDSNIKKLRRETDKFAFLVGWWVQHERRISDKKRKSQVRTRFLEPAKRLLKTMDDTDFAKEFSQPWGGFVNFDRAKFRGELNEAVAAASKHITAIEKRMARGRSWDHSLKRHHVYMTACFCEYFNHSFQPSRLNSSEQEERHAFQEAVELLAKPLFKSGGRGSGFRGAIRDHVDGWNAAKNELFAKMKSSVL
jgi:hypothetical protein